jgi:undecaprenyl-diphosphatase
MTIIQGIILGIVQGLTEFIPVSSSGHLVLIPWALNWPQPGLLFDTMVHWGTLLAVLSYFWRDWRDMLIAFFRSLFTRGPWNAAPGGRLADPHSRLAWGVILGTLPAVIIGFLLESFFERMFGTPVAVAAFLFGTAAILFIGERFSHPQRNLETLSITDALIVGVGQAIAVLPGISRSGTTIVTGMLRGLDRESAARFSFMLAMPAILGAGVLQLAQVLTGAEAATTSAAVIVAGFLAAAISGYLCIKYLLAYLRHGRLYVFAAYCAIVGALGLILAAVR